MFGGLISLIVLAAIVYGIVRLVGFRNADKGGHHDEGDIREVVVRIFRLGLLAAAVSLAAEGLAALFGEAFPPGDGEVARDPRRIAQALSFTIVGVPAAAALAWWTKRHHESEPNEKRSVVWAAFLGGSLIVALIVAVANLNQVLHWLLAGEAFEPRALGQAVVWSAVVAGFWFLNQQRRLHDDNAARTPTFVLAGSTVGLAVGGFWLWDLGRVLIRAAVDPLWNVTIFKETNRFGLAVALAVLGVGIWLWFWWFDGRRSPRTDRWYTYVLLVGVLSGLIVSLSAAGTLIHSILQWFIGKPDAATAAVHFELLPGSLSALAVGGGIWLHHRSLITRRESGERIEPDRIYDYLGAAAGLLLIAAAATMLIAAFIEAVFGADLVQRSLANATVVAATFAIVGAPLLVVFWGRAQRLAALVPTSPDPSGPDPSSADPSGAEPNSTAPAEVHAPTRRVYLIAALGLSAAVALVALVVSLTIFLEDVASGSLSTTTLFRLRVGLGLIVTTTAIAAYHFVIYRDDRRWGEPPPRSPTPEIAPEAPRLVVVTDPGQVRAMFDNKDGPEGVLVTRSDDVDVVSLLEEALDPLRRRGDR